MTAPNARIGFGIRIAFLTSLIEVEVLDLDWDGLQRSVIDSSHHGSTLADAGAGEVGSRTKIPGKLVDAGTVKVEGHYAGSALRLIEGAKETIEITMPLEDGEVTAEKFSFQGFASNVKPFKAGLDEKLMISFDLAISGKVTRTAAA